MEFVVSTHANSRVACPLIAMQKISGLERQFAGNFDDGNAAVDGVDVDHSDGAGNGCDSVDQVFVGFGNDDCGMADASVIGGGDEFFDLLLGQFINFFEDDLHFGGGGSTHNKGDRFAVGPVIGLSFADFDEIGQGDAGDRIGLIGNDGKVAGRG